MEQLIDRQRDVITARRGVVEVATKSRHEGRPLGERREGQRDEEEHRIGGSEGAKAPLCGHSAEGAESLLDRPRLPRCLTQSLGTVELLALNQLKKAWLAQKERQVTVDRTPQGLL